MSEYEFQILLNQKIN